MRELVETEPVKLNVDRIEINDDEVELIDIIPTRRARFSYIVNSSGFDGEWFLQLLPREIREKMPKDRGEY